MTNVPNNQNPEDPSDNDPDEIGGTADFSSGDFGTIDPLPPPGFTRDDSSSQDSPSELLPLPTATSDGIPMSIDAPESYPTLPTGMDSAESLPTMPSDSGPISSKDLVDSHSETVDLSVSSQSNDPSQGSLVYEGSSDSGETNTVVYDSSVPGSGALSTLGTVSSGGGLGSGGSAGSGGGIGSGGSGGRSGSKTPVSSNERLHRDWDVAIRSSGKGSQPSLRFDRSEASDSVLERIATRTVAEANVDKLQQSRYDYALQDKLGEGGMGLVFSALQTAVNRVVALKTLKKDKNGDPAQQKQFFFEAEITADLDHPNIPPIYELGVNTDGTYFYTMKRIKGSEWQRSISKNSQEKNLEIFERLTDAIGFAHSKQILHLDIKPENVIVGAYGEVYVADWGLAHNMAKDSPVRCGGTPDYMAPEMARKAQDLVGKQTDIYLLGAVLFQMVTGKTPHAGSDTKDKKKLQYNKLVDAYHNKIRPSDSNNPLLQVALKAMSTNVADRYATVEDLQSAVREIVEENTNIKTSMELTKSSKTTLQLAEKSQDYERFNRAIFGFQNAVEVWTGNKEAEEELSKARLAFGKCAFDKGDYEVALQTLDRKVAEESELFDKAQKAKTVLLQRESRFKLLRNALFGLLALGGVGATGAAIWINAARTEAERQTRIAIEQKNIADQKTKDAIAAQMAEKEQRDIADQKTKDAIAAQMAEKEQRDIADQKTKDAIAAQMAEKEQRGIADQKTEEALARLAQVKVNEQLTQIGFASAQADKANLVSAVNSLKSLEKNKLGEDAGIKAAFKDGIPKLLDNWASHRVSLLSNKDLETQELASRVTAIDFAAGSGRGIAGLRDGSAVTLTLQDGKLVMGSKPIPVGPYVVAASLSPKADEAILAVAKDESGAEAKLMRIGLDGGWSSSEEIPAATPEVGKAQNRFFQGFAYSPDGTKVVAGIRGGVLMKNLKGEGSTWESLTSKIKGLLRDVDWLDDEHFLVLSENDTSKERNLHLVSNIGGSIEDVKSGLVDLQNASGRITQVGCIGNNKLIVATEGGGLTIHSIDLSPPKDKPSFVASLVPGQALPNEHRKTVNQIDISPSKGRMLTGSGESVVYAWTIEPSSGSITYDTFLTGAPSDVSIDSNIDKSTFIDDQRVIMLDQTGSAVAIDIERQKQRRELTRQSYQARVLGIHPLVTSETSNRVLSVDENGVVDQWDLVTGKTETIAGEGERYSYFGHTPGSKLFDTVINDENDIVITSALLPQSEESNPYIGKRANVEFCVWDRATGNMIRRWADTIGNPEPRLTLLGKVGFYVGSDTSTVVFDYEGNKKVDISENGATFAVVNPNNPDLVAMCQRDAGSKQGKGVLRIWNRAANEWNPGVNNPVRSSEMPVHAAWSSDGQRLYVLDMVGRITPFVLSKDNKLEKATATRSDRGSEDDGYIGIKNTLGKEKEVEASKVLNVLRSFQDVDFVVKSNNGATGDLVICNVRERTLFGGEQNDKTSTFTFSFAAEGNELRISSGSTYEPKNGLYWLDDLAPDNATPKRAILSKRRVGDQMFVSFGNGRVYSLSEQGGNPVLFGRQKFRMSTSDRKGDRLMALYEDGSILQLQIQPEGSRWSRAKYKLEDGEDRISLSPDGQELAVYNPSKKMIRVLNAEGGKTLREIAEVAEFEWNPEPNSEKRHSLAILASDGSLKIEGEDAPVHKGLDLKGQTPTKLAFFEEKLSDEGQEKVLRYLLIQTESSIEDSKEGKVFFVSRDSGATGENASKVFEPSVSISKGVKISVSPTDSIIATGDSTGKIGIWFASPRYQIFNPVYDIDRKQATSVERIAFSGDGSTLITSDQQRVSAWMSIDKLTSEKK